MPDHELYCNPAVHESGKRDHRAVVAEVGAEFPDGTLLAGFLCRTGCAEFFPADRTQISILLLQVREATAFMSK